MSIESPVPRTAVPLGITDPVESARAELKAALSAIEEKTNLPKQVARKTDEVVTTAGASPDGGSSGDGSLDGEGRLRPAGAGASPRASSEPSGRPGSGPGGATPPPTVPGSACVTGIKFGSDTLYSPYPCGRQSWRQIQ